MTHQPLGPDIFYPSDPRELSALVDDSLEEARRGADLSVPVSRVMIIPHGWYQITASMLARPWAAVSGFSASAIVLLLPVHSEHSALCTPNFSALNSPMGPHPAEPYPSLQADASLHLEEPALDNALPFITRVFPNVPVLPVFVPPGTSGDAKRLSNLLKQHDSPGTLYVISCNLTGHIPLQQGEQHSAHLLSLLGADSETYAHMPVLEPFRRRMISPCNSISIEALRRSPMLQGPYRVLGSTASPVRLGRAVHYAGCIGTAGARRD